MCVSVLYISRVAVCMRYKALHCGFRHCGTNTGVIFIFKYYNMLCSIMLYVI